MIPNSFPFTQGQLSREQYLTLLLLALLDQTGGELRLNAKNLQAVNSGGKLLADWDSDTQQLILRVGSPALVVAEVRGAGWTTADKQPLPQPPSPPDSSRHVVMTDEEAIKRVQQMMAQDRMREWRAQGAAVVNTMPQPDETPKPS